MNEDYFIKRLSKLREKLMGKNLEAFIIANPVNCRYLSGFSGSTVTLLIGLKEAFLITDFRYAQQAQEEAPLFTLITSGPTRSSLEKLCKDYSFKNIAFEQNYLTVYGLELLKGSLSDVNLIPLYRTVEELRVIKDPLEISLIRKAAQITEESFEKILPFIKAGRKEREISIELEYLLKKEGGEKTAFDFIAASGKRSSMPHGTASSKIIEPGDLLTLDFGIKYQGYCSDMTRTVAVGFVGEREKDLYQLVLKAQLEALKHIGPGITGETADDFARKLIAGRGLGSNFGHGLGHGLGLEVHEEPRLAPGIKTILKPNAVVTVEPGVYLPGFGGVRIEDMVLITDEGLEMLTQKHKEELLIL
ncbi:M24 family metallopeptidase [Candidatus Contubernalis alkaliaceticus]|uniref:M24 family metallopeptidase n=1 Tax=Candidatus Contubernalis alkaliaceticus TaxID=338645 RepID=UPI001F4C3A61|nr:Xaa-Pro peptidase family protein [Candidatus Contubernalis alkalaceticus]UNC92560.1 aminopeptidase P family protein [Candidatus Contubernalis alkalaceticus]